MDASDHAAAILQAFEIEPRPLDRIVDDYFRRHRSLGSLERRRIADAAFDVVRWRRFLDGWLAGRGVRKIDHRGRVVALPEALAARGAMPKRFPGGVAAFHSFPDYLYEAFVRAFGKEGAATLAEALNRPATPVLRANLLRASREELLRELASAGIEASPTTRSPFGLRLAGRAALQTTESFRHGHFEVQDEASQLAAIAADPQPGERILDACAGAGGKALAMAMLMEGRGRIVASDPVSAKLAELRERAKRAGATIVEAVATEELLRDWTSAAAFDRVFIDAPCSGTGTLRRSPDLRWRIDPAAIAQRIATQRELLDRYAAFVRPGGRLIYATCSLLPEENGEVVRYFCGRTGWAILHAGEAFRRRHIEDEGLLSEEGFFRTDPRNGDWDGFFAAILARPSTGS